MVKLKEVSWFIPVTLKEKRTCYGSTQKNKEPRLGALAEQKESSSMLVAGRSREKNTSLSGATAASKVYGL